MHQRDWEQWASLASVAAAVVALAAVRLWPRSLALAARLGRVADRRRLLCGLLVAVASFAADAGVALHRGIPRPVVQDEYGYLLAAGTFAHGRLTNPPPPFPEHFETPHVLVRPTYMSKYPPGQGVALAVGQVVADLPIAGVWLSTAVAVAAAYWMLLAFVPAGWATLGAATLATGPLVLQWTQTYWGGSVALLGGALVLGGWARLLPGSVPGWRLQPPSMTVGPAISYALGLIVLANSRPYEGLAFALLLFPRLKPMARLLPALLLLAAGLAAMLYADDRVTGHPFRLPTMEYARQYDVYPKFWPLPTTPTHAYGNAAQAWVHQTFEAGQYRALRTPLGLLHISAERAWTLVTSNLRPAVLWLPLLAGVALARRDRRLRWAIAAIGLTLLALCLETFSLPHYAAPATPAFLLLIVCGWRHLAARRPTVAAAVAVGVLASALILLVAPADPDAAVANPQALAEETPQFRYGRHVVFVRYGPGHDPNNEWVYNGADLASQPVLFARYFGPAADAPVAAAFGDRSAWLLTVGDRSLSLVPYPLPRH